MTVKDSNGSELNDGDSVQVIKDLKVKGTSSTLKRCILNTQRYIKNLPDYPWASAILKIPATHLVIPAFS